LAPKSKSASTPVNSETEKPIGICAKQEHPLAVPLVKKLIQQLAEKRRSFVIEKDLAELLGINEPAIGCDRQELTARCSTIIVLGGDGTLISVSRHPAFPPPVIVGINLGTLGFLTEITVEEMDEIVAQVLEDRAILERRYLLSASVIREGKILGEYTAINDVVLTKEAIARIFGIEIKINGEFAAHVRGDGLIVSSPSGSTAYSLAAGGSIVHPLVDAILLTPICPHTLTSRPLIIPGSSTVHLKVSYQGSTRDDLVYYTVDGQEGMALKDEDEVMITTSQSSVFFVKSPSKNYYQVLGAKLKWANQ
jgi:NAD+ kinase